MNDRQKANINHQAHQRAMDLITEALDTIHRSPNPVLAARAVGFRLYRSAQVFNPHGEEDRLTAEMTIELVKAHLRPLLGAENMSAMLTGTQQDELLRSDMNDAQTALQDA